MILEFITNPTQLYQPRNLPTKLQTVLKPS
jgi:hypothetical protein